MIYVYRTLAVFMLFMSWITSAAQGQCMDGDQESGARYRICVPEGSAWNGNLVIYCHGFVAPYDPVEINEDLLSGPDGRSLANLFVELGYAFAASSYSANGLAIREGLADTLDLREIFAETVGEPVNTYLVGFSMGSLIATQAAEQRPDRFQACLAGCGPVGDFNMQISWFGDFRVAFDYYFPALFPGSPVRVPELIVQNPLAYYLLAVRPFITAPANENKVRQLVSVAGLPYSEASFIATAEQAIASLFFFNGAAPNDTLLKLGGQPFDNRDVWYTGTNNDFLFNVLVERFRADQAALDEIAAHYETSGNIDVPFFLLHTTGDQVVPYDHAPLYEEKVLAAGQGDQLSFMTVDRLGHCNFRSTEVLAAFTELVFMLEGEEASRALSRAVIERSLTSGQQRSNYITLAAERGVPVDRNAYVQAPVASTFWVFLIGLLLEWLRAIF